MLRLVKVNEVEINTSQIRVKPTTETKDLLNLHSDLITGASAGIILLSPLFLSVFHPNLSHFRLPPLLYTYFSE